MRPPRLAVLWAWAGATLAVAAPSAPNPKPAVLYVKTKDTHLKNSSKPSATTLLVLQPGAQVTYLGRDGTTPWHQVTAPGTKGAAVQGVIYQANLSSAPPAMEVISKNPDKPLSPQAFASSGAAIKALGPGAINYGKTLPNPESVEQLAALEKLAQNEVSDADVTAYARAAGLTDGTGAGRIASAVPEAPKGKSKKGVK